MADPKCFACGDAGTYASCKAEKLVMKLPASGGYAERIERATSRPSVWSADSETVMLTSETVKEYTKFVGVFVWEGREWCQFFNPARQYSVRMLKLHCEESTD